jgi:hypothetical protein
MNQSMSSRALIIQRSETALWPAAGMVSRVAADMKGFLKALANAPRRGRSRSGTAHDP